MPSVPRITVLTTGGTIATAADDGGVLRPERSGTQLLTGLTHDIDVDVVDLMCKDSSQLEPVDWESIRSACDSAVTGGADGVVITHGTDTLEETALWLALTYGGCAPVVLTGAMHSADSPNPDGPANLRAALAVASDLRYVGAGALVSFGGKLLKPTGLQKKSGADGAVFEGAAVDSIGVSRHYLGEPAGPIPRVDIVAAYPGADAVAMDACVAAGAQAVVLEALGAGNAGRAVIEGVERLRRTGIDVLLCTRVPGGHVGGDYGPGAAMIAAGAIPVPKLRAAQVRVLTMAALMTGTPLPDAITATLT